GRSDEADADGDVLTFHVRGVPGQLYRDGVRLPSGDALVTPGAGSTSAVDINFIPEFGLALPPFVLVSVTDGQESSGEIVFSLLRVPRPPMNHPPVAAAAGPEQRYFETRPETVTLGSEAFTRWATDPDGDVFAMRIDADPMHLLPDGFAL